MKKMRNFFVALWSEKKKRAIFLALCGTVFLLLLLAIFLLALPEKEPSKGDAPPETEEVFLPMTENEAEPDPPETENSKEDPLQKEICAKGIDVSKWQGKIDWKKVKEAGIQFAMIRLGYYENGACYEDPNAAWNLQEADRHGVLTGVYFYSGATTPNEARIEAEWVLGKIGRFAISYPVVLDYEIASSLSAEARTETVLAFLSLIENSGYEPMLYASLKELEDPLIWQKERIVSQYLVWGARYIEDLNLTVSYPETETPLAMWQYSDRGRVNGISGNVDLNVAYFSREYSAPKKSADITEEAPDDFRQSFSLCDKQVTAKNEVNLRKTPSMDGEIAGTLKNGEYMLCTGESDMGWSRLEKEGEKFYAVTSLLISSTGESETPNQVFADCREEVTAKLEVNLRLAPSTDAEIAGVLQNGTRMLRTGIGDKGWSRLDLDGTPVYAITSYLELAE